MAGVAHDLAEVLTGGLAPLGLQFGTNGDPCAKFELTAFDGEATLAGAAARQEEK
jgi:hypothetical protein